jgi:hypothetical protein
MSRRLNYYGDAGLFFGYPTLIVDGLKEPTFPYSVGSITNEIINRHSIQTPVTIELVGTKSTGKLLNTFDRRGYSATITSEHKIASQNLRFIIFVVETSINYNAPNGTQWQNHVARDILPNENGVPIDLSNENEMSVQIDGTFETNSDWNLENLSIVAILQDFHTREVLQATELAYGQFLGTTDNNISLPPEFTLDNVFPNPFNPNVNIPFSIQDESHISLKVINIIGEEVDTLIEDKSFSPGNYTVQWNATTFPAGTYFISMITQHGKKIKKLFY